MKKIIVIIVVIFLISKPAHSTFLNSANNALRVPLVGNTEDKGDRLKDAADDIAKVNKWNEIWSFELQNPKVEGPSSLAQQLVKEKKIKDGQEILSLGAGYGKDEVYFVENIDCKVIATDFSQVVVESMGNIAKQRNLEFKGELKVKNQDITKKFDFSDNSFDVVYTHQSLMYFIDDEEIISIIREIHRVLKLGGKVFISVRSINDWKYAENPMAINNVAIGEDGISRRFFDRQSLRKLFERLNFGDMTIEENIIDRYKKESPATVLYLFATKKDNLLYHKELRNQI